MALRSFRAMPEYAPGSQPGEQQGNQAPSRQTADLISAVSERAPKNSDLFHREYKWIQGHGIGKQQHHFGRCKHGPGVPGNQEVGQREERADFGRQKGIACEGR